MKVLFRKGFFTPENIDSDLTPSILEEDIEKTRRALHIAYAGFDYATDPDMIDAYIFQINSLLLKYKHLHEHTTTGSLV